MANILKLSRLIDGVQRNVDLSTNTLVVDALKVGGSGGIDLTQTILARLINTQNGSDLGTLYHSHNSQYHTKTELNKDTAAAGSTLIGDDDSYTNFTPTSASVKGALAGIDSALAASASALDGTFRIKNTADETKQLAFDASAITTGTTRTLSMPDANVNLADVNNAILRNGSRAFTAAQSMGANKLTNLAVATASGDAVAYQQAILASGANAFAADQSLGGFKLTNVADPVAAQDAVTLSFMNARLNGLTPKAPVRVATLVAGTLATSFEAGDTIDGVVLVASDRILIKNQAAPEQNGIYVVQATGAPVRSTDMDSLTPFDEFNGAWVTVREGTQAGQVFVQYGEVATVGTDPINFAYYNPIAGLIGGDMITFAGSTFSVDLATTSGLESTNPGNVAGQLRVKLESSSPTLQINGSNQLGLKIDSGGALEATPTGVRVVADGTTIEIFSSALRIKDAGVSLAKLASNSVDENKIVSTTFSATGAITGGSGTKIAVAVDNTSVEINSNALRVKSTAYDQSTITGGSGSAAAVQHAPAVKEIMVAGEAYGAGELRAVRFAKAADAGFVAGRMYKADNDATTVDNFWVIGLVFTVGAVAAAGALTVVKNGSITAAGHGLTVGQPLFLSSSGTLTQTAPSTANLASLKVGIVRDANTIEVQIGNPSVN